MKNKYVKTFESFIDSDEERYFDFHIQLDEDEGYSKYLKLSKSEINEYGYEDDDSLINLALKNGLIDQEESYHVDDIVELSKEDYKMFRGY